MTDSFDIYDHFEREDFENLTQDEIEFYDPFDVYEDDDFNHIDYTEDESLV